MFELKRLQMSVLLARLIKPEHYLTKMAPAHVQITFTHYVTLTLVSDVKTHLLSLCRPLCLFKFLINDSSERPEEPEDFHVSESPCITHLVLLFQLSAKISDAFLQDPLSRLPLFGVS